LLEPFLPLFRFLRDVPPERKVACSNHAGRVGESRSTVRVLVIWASVVVDNKAFGRFPLARSTEAPITRERKLSSGVKVGASGRAFADTPASPPCRVAHDQVALDCSLQDRPEQDHGHVDRARREWVAFGEGGD
jgi:hypothetical protein